MFNRRCFLFVSVFLLNGCGDNDFTDRYELGEPRILGLILSAPEVSPGQTTTVSPILSFENQNSEIIEHRLRGCPDPGLSFGVDPTCEGVSDLQTIQDWTSFTFSNPAVKSEILGSLGTVTVPGDYLETATDVEKVTGRVYLIEYSVRVDGTQILNAFSRLRVTDAVLKPTKNQNPILQDLLYESSSLTVRPTNLKGALSVSFDSSSLDTGETLLTSYFVSRGEIDFSRTLGTQFTSWELTQSELDNQDKLTVIAIGRDERGGLAALIRTGL
jgi:hypothetical protein